MYYGQNYLDWVQYDYDTLSRLNWEERRFNELNAAYKISYEYNLAGQVKKITDPTDATGNTYISYSFNKAGEMTAATGTPSFLGITQYLSNLQYRAWGAVKDMSFGNGYQASTTYTTRMQAYEFNFRQQGADPSLPGALKTRYDYFNDGFVKNAYGLSDRKLDRAFTYDHKGRLMTVRSGSEAGLGGSEPTQFKRDYDYDAFDHMKYQNGYDWNKYNGNYSATYTNDKVSNATTWTNIGSGITENFTNQHDNSGNITSELRQRYQGSQLVDQGQRQFLYDVVGRFTGEAPSNPISTVFYDGDGQRVKDGSVYFVTSSILRGQIIARLNSSGQKETVYIYANGRLLAHQSWVSGQPSAINWYVRDPHNTSERKVTTTGSGSSLGEFYSVDPLGAQIYAATSAQMNQYWQGQFSPPSGYQPPIGLYSKPSDYSTLQNALTHGRTCTLDGRQENCDKVLRGINNGLYEFPHDLRFFVPSWDKPFLPVKAGALEDRNIYELLFTQGLDDEQQDGRQRGGIRDMDQIEANYSNCISRLHVSPNVLTKEKVKTIVSVSHIANVDPTLLAATMQFESYFDDTVKSNLNDGTLGNADIGPMQINFNTFYNDPSIRWLGVEEVFGYTPYPASYGTDDLGVALPYATEQFNGNVIRNIWAGGIILSGYGGTRKSSAKARSNAAGFYRTGRGQFSRSPRGLREFKKRKESFDKVSPAYDEFFNCLGIRAFR
jgi:hypothetical protein